MSSRLHIHPAVPFLSRLPVPTPEIGEAARDAAKILMAALNAQCNRCYSHTMNQLNRGQQRAANTTFLSGRPGQPVPPGPVEALYADMLWCAASLIIAQATGVGVDPRDHAAGYAHEFLGPEVPADLRQSTHIVLSSVSRLVDQDADDEAALELAQGVITTGFLLGVDGHAMLMQQTEMAVRLTASIAYGDLNAR